MPQIKWGSRLRVITPDHELEATIATAVEYEPGLHFLTLNDATDGSTYLVANEDGCYIEVYENEVIIHSSEFDDDT